MLLNNDQQHLLLALARQSIEEGLRTGRPLALSLEEYSAALLEKRATFVTLQKNRALRGCIGRLEAVRPLVTDVVANAFAAAFQDSRFPPLAEEELEHVDIHVSILTTPEAMFFSSEADLLRQLQPGIDGLILESEGHRGTFLPAVWASLPTPEHFLRQLKLKAGLMPEYWSDAVNVSRYRTETFP